MSPTLLPFPSPQTLRLLLEREQDDAFIDLLSTALQGSPVSKIHSAPSLGQTILMSFSTSKVVFESGQT